MRVCRRKKIEIWSSHILYSILEQNATQQNTKQRNLFSHRRSSISFADHRKQQTSLFFFFLCFDMNWKNKNMRIDNSSVVCRSPSLPLEFILPKWQKMHHSHETRSITYAIKTHFMIFSVKFSILYCKFCESKLYRIGRCFVSVFYFSYKSVTLTIEYTFTFIAVKQRLRMTTNERKCIATKNRIRIWKSFKRSNIECNFYLWILRRWKCFVFLTGYMLLVQSMLMTEDDGQRRDRKCNLFILQWIFSSNDTYQCPRSRFCESHH